MSDSKHRMNTEGGAAVHVAAVDNEDGSTVHGAPVHDAAGDAIQTVCMRQTTTTRAGYSSILK